MTSNPSARPLMSTTASSVVQRVSYCEKYQGTTVERGPGTVTSQKHASVEERHALFHSLPPPPPFALSIEDLSIGVPPHQHYLPLPVPVPVPSFLGINGADNSDQTILRNVSAFCGSGEILALCVLLAQLPYGTIDKHLLFFHFRIGGSGSGKSTLLAAIVNRLANLPIRSG